MPKDKLLRASASAVAAAGYLVVGVGLIPAHASASTVDQNDRTTITSTVLSNVTPDCWTNPRNRCCQPD